MTKRSKIAAALQALLLAACAPQPPVAPAPVPPAGSVPTAAAPAPPAAPAPAAERIVAEDPHSFARPAEARVTHVDLDLTADFASRRLHGTAALDVQRSASAREIVLDTRDLTIHGVTDGQGRPLDYRLGQVQGTLGQPLHVALPEGVDRVVIRYETAPGAAALQWLTPEQTAGERHPYLFTQGQTILTRTWVPTQDSPGIRQTYSARIAVPRGLKAVMSAEMLTPDGEPAGGALTAFRFRMQEPIPPYLIALAIGDLAFQSLGARTGVYTEPAMLERAAYELAEMEEMLEAAERLYGPYRWGRYDVLVLPPSFPYGGMENPRLTFATPTILAGDRSLVSLIAHELAHSWSGNLVTNATWNDFWLNEGFTTYFEQRIMEALRGREYADMLRLLGRRELAQEIERLGATSPDTRLYLDLAGRDPDEGTSEVAYEKGAAFLQTVEQAVGRERFDAFLRTYFDRFAFRPMTTQRFVEYLRNELIRGDADLERRIALEEWIYQPGVPANAPAIASQAFARVEAEARRFAEGAPASSLATEGWTTHEWLHFIHSLPERLPQDRLADLDRTFGFTRTGNSEILFAWLRSAIRNRYEPAMPRLEEFLTSMGRRKFLAPLYTDLAEREWGRPIAARIYRQARASYHPVSTGTIDQILPEVAREFSSR